MNFNLAARLAAVAIGASFMLTTISRSAGLIARHSPDVGLEIYLLSAVLIAAAAILAWIIFAYAKRLKFEREEISASGVLVAGVKLFGIYWVITAVPSLVGALSISQISFEESVGVDLSVVVARMLTSAIYLAIGLLFVLRSNWVLAIAARDMKDELSKGC